MYLFVFLVSKIILILTTCISLIKLWKNYKKIDTEKINLDMISWIEIATIFGFSIVLVGSQGTMNLYLFLSFIIILLTVIIFYQLKRIVFVEGDYLIARNKIFFISEINGYEVHYFTLILENNNKLIKIHRPLTSRQELAKLTEKVKPIQYK